MRRASVEQGGQVNARLTVAVATLRLEVWKHSIHTASIVDGVNMVLAVILSGVL